MNKQNSLITRYCLAATIVLALLGPLAQNGRGDFILWNNEQYTVDMFHGQGILFDTSRASIVAGGGVEDLYACNFSTVDITGGDVGILNTYGFSVVDMLGGYVGHLYAWHSSSIDISSGSVYYLCTWNSSAVDISGGSISGTLYAQDSSTVDISGGSVGYLNVCSSSTANISGGSIYDLTPCDSGTVDITGGLVQNLNACGFNVVVTLEGRNFSVSGGLTLYGDRVLGTGLLSGEWMDGTPWTMNIYQNDPTATIWAVSGPTIIPTPGALMLAGIGAGCIHWLRKARAL
jgi:hypothetical protein